MSFEPQATDLRVLAGRWLKRDAVVLAGAMLGSIVLATFWSLTSTLTEGDLAMATATPLVVAYLELRLVGVLVSRYAPKVPSIVAPPLIEACSTVGSISLCVGLVASGSWLVFEVYGPSEAAAMSAQATAGLMMVFAGTLVVSFFHDPIVAGHRLLIRPCIARTEFELVRVVQWVRRVILRGQPTQMFLP